MSDFGSESNLPAPPGGTPPPPPPFGGYGAPPPPPGYQPTGYYPVAGATQKPPRPAVQVGSMLLIAGGVLMILGCFLEWFAIEGESFNGFSGNGDNDVKDGPVFVFFGVLALGFGIAQLMAKRMLAVAIIAVVFTSFALLGVLADLGDVSDLKDLADIYDADFSQGPGLWIILLGAGVALAGGIATLAKRRTWPKAI